MPTNNLTASSLTSGSAAFFMPSFNPPVVIHDYALDNGMITFPTLCDRIYVCTGPITDFASVTATALGFKNFGAGNAFGGISNGVPSGRTVTSIAFTDGSISTSGLAVCWAAVDFADSHLLAWGVLAGDAQVNSGQLFGLPSFIIHEPAYFSGVGITLPFAANSLTSLGAFFGTPLALTPNLNITNLAASAAGIGVPVMKVGYPFTAFNFVPNKANAFGTPAINTSKSFTANNLAAGAAGFANSKPALSINGVGGGVPVVTGGTRTIAMPMLGGANVGAVVSATNSPTSWSITSQPYGTFFSITSGGQIQIKQGQLPGTTVDVPPQSYALTVQATNGSGSGSATVTVSVTTSGTIFYVSTSGSDSAAGTLAAPFLTFNKAATACNAAGDVALFMAGTYSPTSFSISNSGTAAHPIMFAPYQGAAVTFTCTNIASGSCINLNGSYTTFMGFNIQGSGTKVTDGVALFNTTGSRVSGCTINGFYQSGVWVGTADGSNVIINNIVSNNCQSNLNHKLGSAGGWGQGITFNSNSNQAIGNTVFNNWGEGIGVQSCTGCTVSFNTVYDNYSVLIYPDASNNLVINNNFCYSTTSTYGYLGSGRPDGIRFSREGTAHPNANNLVANNIVIGTISGCGYDNAFNSGGMQNNIIVNNTFINNSGSCILFESDSGNSGNVVENNIMYGSNPSGVTAGYSYNHNCWFSSTAGSFAGTGDVNANPSFTGTAGADTATAYQLNSGSPCKNAGLNLTSSAVTVDYGNNARPSSGNFTIGAWQ